MALVGEAVEPANIGVGQPRRGKADDASIVGLGDEPLAESLRSDFLVHPVDAVAGRLRFVAD